MRPLLPVAVPVALVVAWNEWTPAIEQSSAVDDAPTALTIVAPWASHVLAWSAVGLAALVFVLAPQRPRGWLPGRNLAGFGFLVTVLGLFGCWFGHSLDWRVAEEFRGLDGMDYALLRHGIWGGGYTESFGRGSSAGRVVTRYEVLATGCVGEDGFEVPMVGVAVTPEPHVVFGPSGFIAAVREGETPWLYDANAHREVVGNDLADASPFALLDANTKGSDADVAAIVARLATEWRPGVVLKHRGRRPALFDRWQIHGELRVPTEETLTDALDSPNAWIRAASRRIIEAGGAEMYPEATRRLAAAPK